MRKWLTVLRDSSTRQTFNQLRDADGRMCALGAACEAYRLDGNDFEWANQQGACVLPDRVAEWLGLYCDDFNADMEGDVISDPLVRVASGNYYKVSRLNDSRCFSLSAIADVIERDPDIGTIEYRPTQGT